MRPTTCHALIDYDDWLMATARRSRTIAAAPQRVWEVIEDPHHMPRWWPGVARMEGVEDDRWTQVFMTKKGRPVRADFRLLESEPPWRRRWEQEVTGTPFERVLNEAVTRSSSSRSRAAPA